MCSESDKVITDFQYYSYEKRSYCCSLAEYAERSAADNFKVPMKKLVLITVPEKLRAEYWINDATGELVPSKPIKPTPLNPNWNFEPVSKSEASQVKKVAIHLQQDKIKDFTDELEHFEVTPRTGQELSQEMHGRGLSLYFLGEIADKAPYPHLKEMAVREIIARTVKALVWSAVRADSASSVSEDSTADKDGSALYFSLIHRYLCLVVSKDTASEAAWKKISYYTQKNFGLSVTQESLADNKLYLRGLVHSIFCQLKVRSADPFLKELDFEASEPLSVNDIVEMSSPKSRSAFQSQLLQSLSNKAQVLDVAGSRTMVEWYSP